MSSAQRTCAPGVIGRFIPAGETSVTDRCSPSKAGDGNGSRVDVASDYMFVARGDLGGFCGAKSKPYVVSIREVTGWVVFYGALAAAFGIGMWACAGGRSAGQSFAGYLTEYSLSMDNLFVFAVIMAAFRVPIARQNRVLLVGIAIALAMRGVCIVLGAAALQRFSWILYVFAMVLMVTACRLLRGEEPRQRHRNTPLPRLLGKMVSMSGTQGSSKGVRLDRKRHLAPILVVMITIGATDLLFALDSIPAVFGLTTEPYVVFTANAFALLGLRQLYFLLGGLLDRLVYLRYGLSVILAFIGVKLLLEGLRGNEFPFLNNDEPIAAPDIGIAPSLVVIVGTLVVTAMTSLLKARRDARRHTRQRPGVLSTGGAVFGIDMHESGVGSALPVSR